jgi:hypothetical protein
MKRKHFSLLHSIAIVIGLLIVEMVVVFLFRMPALSVITILVLSLGGAIGIIFIATEAIREVRNADHMLMLLSSVIAEFIVFFAFQYWYLSLITPASFQGLLLDPVSLLLNSTMIFALNPLYLPLTSSAKILMTINSLGALALVLFVIQNIWQFREKTSNSDHL